MIPFIHFDGGAIAPLKRRHTVCRHVVNFRRIPLAFLEYIAIPPPLALRCVTFLCFLSIKQSICFFSLLLLCHKYRLTQLREIQASMLMRILAERRTTISLKNRTCFLICDISFRLNMIKRSIMQVRHQRFFDFIFFYFHIQTILPLSRNTA